MFFGWSPPRPCGEALLCRSLSWIGEGPVKGEEGLGEVRKWMYPPPFLPLPHMECWMEAGLAHYSLRYVQEFLPARRYASAGLCDSDVSVRPSVRRAPVLCLAERKQDREMYTV